MTQHYIGTKQVTAWAEAKDGKPGYSVKYEDGYISWSPKEAFEAAYIAVGHVGHLPPFHQRLIGERAQLSDRICKLAVYSGSVHFLSLDSGAQDELDRQMCHMLSYRRVLDERLATLKEAEPSPTKDSAL